MVQIPKLAPKLSLTLQDFADALQGNADPAISGRLAVHPWSPAAAVGAFSGELKRMAVATSGFWIFSGLHARVAKRGLVFEPNVVLGHAGWQLRARRRVQIHGNLPLFGKRFFKLPSWIALRGDISAGIQAARLEVARREGRLEGRQEGREEERRESLLGQIQLLHRYLRLDNPLPDPQNTSVELTKLVAGLMEEFDRR